MALIDLLKNRTITWSEIKTLLNLIKQPCVLVDQEDTIALVNSALIELTAYPIDEIVQTPIRSLIVNERTKDGKIVQKIIRKNRPPLDVLVQKDLLDDKQHWKVYTVKALSQVSIGYPLEIEQHIESITNMMDKTGLDYDLYHRNCLETLQKEFRFDVLKTYWREQDIYRLDARDLDEENAFPEVVPCEELKKLTGFEVWQQGNRTLNILHRTARKNYINTLITYNYKFDEDQGIVVAGWKEQTRDNSVFRIVQQYLDIYQKQVSVIRERREITGVHKEKENTEKINQILVDNVIEGIILLNDEWQILDINHNMEKLLGYRKWEAKELTIGEYLAMERPVTEVFAELSESGDQGDKSRVVLHRRDGEEEPVILSIHKLVNENVQYSYLLLIEGIRDREAMQSTIKELQHQAALGKSVANFAHEVRNPVNNMSVNIQALTEIGEWDETQKDMLTGMINDCDRLDHLMNSILSYTKPLEDNMKPLNLDFLLHDVIDTIEKKLLRNNVELVYQCEENLPLIVSNMRALEQVFTNLINNAVDAMKALSGGTLAIKTEKGREGFVQVNVSDTGVGIPEEIKKTLFTPFSSFSQKGTGLGLAITKQIITELNGEISVESIPGATVFHVLLPIYKGDSE